MLSEKIVLNTNACKERVRERENIENEFDSGWWSNNIMYAMHILETFCPHWTTIFWVCSCIFEVIWFIRFGLGNLAWYKYILSIHIANNSIRCLNVDVGAARNEQAAKRYFCSLFKVPLLYEYYSSYYALLLLLLYVVITFSRTLTKAIDKIYTYTHKKKEQPKKITFKSKTFDIICPRKLTDISFCRIDTKIEPLARGWVMMVAWTRANALI